MSYIYQIYTHKLYIGHIPIETKKSLWNANNLKLTSDTPIVGAFSLILLIVIFSCSVAMAQRTTFQSNETAISGDSSSDSSDTSPPSNGAGQISTKLGSSGDDLLSGSGGGDLILGLQGSDTIKGEGGIDIIQGDEDPDKLYGGEGSDIVQGGLGSDLLYGESGNDILSGGIDDDMLSGGSGNDKQYGGEGDDVLQGGLGADFFDCGAGVDIVIDSNVTEGDDSSGNCEELLDGVEISATISGTN
jgi:Ca2+-binding RTX toxin-like protein